MTTAVAPQVTECTVVASDLDRWVKSVRQVIRGTTTIPALRCLRLMPGAIAATNMETTIITETPGMNLDCSVESSALLAALEVLDSKQEVTLTTDGPQMVVQQGRMKTSLQLSAVGEYPELPSTSKTARVSLTAVQVREAMMAAQMAGTDDTRPVLTAVCLKVRSADKGRVSFGATDSYRLAEWADVPAEMSGIAGSVELLIPHVSLKAAVGLMGKGEGGLVIGFDPDQPTGVAVLRAGATVVATRLIDGQFPNTDQLVPDREQMTPVALSAESAEDLLRMLKSVGSNSSSPARFALERGSHEARVSVVDDEMHVIRELTVVLQSAWAGETINIGANAGFFAAVMEASGTHTPHIISPLRPFGFFGERTRALVMPIRLNG